VRLLDRFAVGCAAAVLVLGTSGCAALGKAVSFTDPETGEVVETTVGDLAADTVEGLGATLSDVVGGAATVATGNPIIGAGAGAALLTLVLAGAAKLRRKG